MKEFLNEEGTKLQGESSGGILGKICQTVQILKNFSRTARVQTYLVS